MKVKTGLKGEASMEVIVDNTALEMGSGSVPVFATPMLIAVMEKAAVNALENCLEEGSSSVGVYVNCRHLAATPVGMTIIASAELVKVDGKRLIFRVEAFDEVEKVGEGEHERYIINLDSFLQRSNKKKDRL